MLFRKKDWLLETGIILGCTLGSPFFGQDGPKPTPLITSQKTLNKKYTVSTFLYTYIDKKGKEVTYNMPPAFLKGQGLTLKHVGVGHVHLAQHAAIPAGSAQAADSSHGPLHSPTQLYQWVDDNGRLQISDQPPAKAMSGVKTYQSSAE